MTTSDDPVLVRIQRTQMRVIRAGIAGGLCLTTAVAFNLFYTYETHEMVTPTATAKEWVAAINSRIDSLRVPVVVLRDTCVDAPMDSMAGK